MASQSQERANFYNYTVSGQKGTFNETIGSSGTLSFTDADANTLFALTPSFNLAAGATQNLLFEAHFDNTALGIPVGASLRAEILVTFGGAGARGGGNASASNIDVNGDMERPRLMCELCLPDSRRIFLRFRHATILLTCDRCLLYNGN